MSSKFFDKNNIIYKKGLSGEKIALDFLINHKMDIIEEEYNKNGKYDIKTNNGTYEIKLDDNYIKYGSVFVEFQTIYNNHTLRFTGINISNADYYLFVCPVDYENKKFKIFQIMTKYLKEYINNSIQNNKYVVRSADCKTWEKNTNNNIIGKNYGYIIDDEILLKYGSVYSWGTPPPSIL